MKKLEVRIVRNPGDERVVGQLAEDNREVYFEYAAAFLSDPLWLSPFRLPPEPGLLRHTDHRFGPIFGLFDDSLPDGWGLLLMDRYFRQQALDLAEVSVLHRLAYLGARTMGALTYHPPATPEEQDPRILDLHDMAHAAQQVLEGPAADVLPALLRAGGSPGGARPKVLVGLSDDSIISGEQDLPEGFSYWIVKFHAKEDPEDTGAVELAYARMAEEARIVMPETRLFETSAGEAYFGVERFDRRGGRRYHVHTLGNLIHSNYRIPSCDYQQLLQVTQVLTKDQRDVRQCLRRAAFNVITHNRDDHVKNFAFRLNDADEWELAPAYDLIFAPGPGGEHSMTVSGEGRAPGRDHLLQLASRFDIPDRHARSILDEVAGAASRWPRHARDAGVGTKSLKQIQEAIDTCLAPFL